MNKKKNKLIKIIPLGGVGELGKNMYIVEVEEDLFILDAGLMFPEDEMFGIDIVIPDISYLKENKERIRGIYLSHGHEDHTGALAYILKVLPLPVYATKLTIALTKAKLKEQHFTGKADFHTVTEDTILSYEHATVSFFNVNHTIPDSVGICINTDQGAIVYTGDFKFDQSADELYRANMSKMSLIGDEGVLCLLSDSTEAERSGFTPSELAVEKELEHEFEKAKGRIIYACYASELNSIQRLLNVAAKSGRKVAIIGQTLQDVFNNSLKLGCLKVQDELIMPFDEAAQLNEDEVVILMTGNHGEPLEALQKMIKKSHKFIHINRGDTVLIAASPHRGGELFLAKTVDMLYRVGANVVTGLQIHVNGHGREEELKLMLNLMRPKFFIPIHGEYRMLVAHGKIAERMNISRDRIMIPEKGDVIEIKGGKIKLSGRVTAGNILIDGSGIGDVGNIVLRDRKMLSQDGILIVVVSINRSEKKIVSGPEIISRGFVYVRESEELMGDATGLVKEIVDKNINSHLFEWSTVKQEIRDQLNYYLYNKTKRRPMIIPIIMEI